MHNLRTGMGLVAGRVKAWMRGEKHGAGMIEALEGRALMSAFVVTDASDDVVSPVDGSLRWAINMANGDTEPSSITFSLPTGTSTILLEGYLPILDSVSIVGPGSGLLSLDAQGLGRVIEVKGGDVTLEGLTVTGGAVTDGKGAGIYAHGGNSLTLVDVGITNNKGTDTGSAGAVSLMGVGLYSSMPAVSILDSTISGNAADGGGLGVGAYFEAPRAGATVSLVNSKVTGNLSTVTTTTSAGVGMFFSAGLDAVLVQTVVENNRLNIVNQDISGLRGVGIANEGSLGVSQSIVHGNTAETPGTYVYVHGGGIYSNNVLSLSQSEVSYNTLGRGPGAGVFAYGTLNLLNSTVAYNAVLTHGQGAGVYYGTNGATGLDQPQVHFSTVYGNSVGDDAGSDTTGGIYADPANPVQLINSVVAGNTVASGGGAPLPTDVSGSFVGLGQNLVKDASRGTVTGAVTTGVDPGLNTELDFHGGPTRTLVPTVGSAVIDAGDNIFSPGVDQRGFARPNYADAEIVDLGAVEAGGILSGRIFHDVNGNGLYDDGDGYPSSGSDKAIVFLYSVGQDGLLDTGDEYLADSVTVDLFGYYGFFNVGDGDYYLSFELPANYHFGMQQLGTPGGSRVYAQGAQMGDTPVYSVVKGTYEEYINVAAVADTSLQVLMYVDVDGDSVFTAGTDTALESVGVTLTSETDTGFLVTVATDANGYATFSNSQAPAGDTYVITASGVTGYGFSALKVGTLGGKASGDNQVTGVGMTVGGQGTGYEFGLTKASVGTGSVQVHTFVDKNQNGRADVDESYLSAVQTRLHSVGKDGVKGGDDDVLIGEQYADGSGLLYFADLAAGDYYLEYTAPEQTRLTKQDLSDPTGSQADGSAKAYGSTPVFTVTGGQSVGVRQGFVRYVAVSVVTFIDSGVDPAGYPDPVTAGDGIYQSYVDFALENATVTLTGVADIDGSIITQSHATNEYGNVYFYLLEPGTYSVTVTTPSGLSATQAIVGSHSGTASGDNVSISGITVDDGAVAEGYQFAFLPAMSISGFVYGDTIVNGSYDHGYDEKLAGVSLDVFHLIPDSDGLEFYAYLTTVTTNSDGRWILYNGLEEGGTYKVAQLTTCGYLPSGATAGSAGGQADGLNGVQSIVINAKDQAHSYLFSNARPNRVTGVVQSVDGEVTTPLPGVVVTITVARASGSTSWSVTTDDGGGFDFGDLLPGSYSIRINGNDVPAGYVFTESQAGTGGGSASKLEIVGIDYSTVSGVQSTGNTFTFHQSLATVTGVAFEDVNQNGVWDEGESTLHRHVKLYNAGADKTAGTGDDFLVAETGTNAEGVYAFEEPGAGDYYVQFEIGSEQRMTRPDLVSTNGSRADSMGNTGVFAVAADSGVTTASAGYVNFASILVVTFQDVGENASAFPDPIVPRDGVYQYGVDPGVSDVIVTVTGTIDFDGSTWTGSYTSEGNGRIEISGLEPGTYTVSVSSPRGVVHSGVSVIDGSGTPGDDGKSVSGVTLASGQSKGQYLFAYLPDTYISGLAYEDMNLNGVFDQGTDAVLSGVTMELAVAVGSGFDVVRNVTTDADGTWYFGGLTGETSYRVREVAPGSLVVQSVTVGSAGGEHSSEDTDAVRTIVLAADQGGTGYEFANIHPNEVSGYVSVLIGSGEPTATGMPGVTVQLTISDGFETRTLMTTTNSEGYYAFSGLRAGQYDVEVISPTTGYVYQGGMAGTEGGMLSTEEPSITGIDLSDNTATNAQYNNFDYREAMITKTFSESSPLSYTDLHGNTVTLSMTGPGTGTAYFPGIPGSDDEGGGDNVLTLLTTDVVTGGFVVEKVEIAGTTAKSTFRVDVMSAAAGYNQMTDIPVIHIAGDIASVVAPRVAFQERFEITGGVGSVTLGDIGHAGSPQALMKLGHNTSGFPAGVTITLGLVANLNIHVSDGRIAQLTAKNWLDDGEDADCVLAASIGGLTISGAPGISGIYGDFQADLALSGKGVADDEPTLNLVNVAGAISDAYWVVSGNIERINTRSGGEEWILNASGLLAYLTTSRSLIESEIRAQSIGILSVRQHLLDTRIYTGNGLTPDLFSVGGISVGGTVINTEVDTHDTGLGTVLITGNIMEFTVKASTLTRLNTGVSMYDSHIEADLIGTIFVSLDMMGTIIKANQELADNKVSLGNLTVYAISMDNSVFSMGSVDNMRFGHLVDSAINIGVMAYDGYYFYRTETGATARLNTLYLSSTIGYTDYKAMSDSDIIVGHLGSVRIYSVDEEIDASYGIVANSLDMYQRRRADGTVLKLTDLENEDSEPEIVDEAGGYTLTLVELNELGG